MEEKVKDTDFTVLPSYASGGPHGLGDPDDRTLRRVEQNVVIPKKVKEAAKKEKCATLVTAFVDCAKTQGLMMPFKCRKENQVLQECIREWFTNPEFYGGCQEKYLDERSEYRRTGLTKKQKRVGGQDSKT